MPCELLPPQSVVGPLAAAGQYSDLDGGHARNLGTTLAAPHHKVLVLADHTHPAPLIGMRRVRRRAAFRDDVFSESQIQSTLKMRMASSIVLPRGTKTA